MRGTDGRRHLSRRSRPAADDEPDRDEAAYRPARAQRAGHL
jgi:hypothetical protein